MKTEFSVFCAMANRPLVLLTLILLPFAGSAWGQTIITLDNTAYQYFAVDTTRHFLFAAESSNAATKHLNVINTLTNTIVGTYSFTAANYSSQLAASGTNVFWADQGSSLARVIAVSGSGVPSLTRSDPAGLATGIAALSTTYAVSKQGTGDYMDIRLISTGALVGSSVPLSGVAGNVFADANTNLYYARSNLNTQVINLSGGIVRTLAGLVAAIDSSAAHNFIYFQSGGGNTVLTQLFGSSNLATGNSFTNGTAYGGVAVNSLNGDVFVSQQTLNQVVHLDSNLAFIEYLAVPNAEALAIIDNQLYVHQAGTTSLSVLAIPEPATWSVLLVGLGLVSAILRRRVKAVPLGAR